MIFFVRMCTNSEVNTMDDFDEEDFSDISDMEIETKTKRERDQDEQETPEEPDDDYAMPSKKSRDEEKDTIEHLMRMLSEDDHDDDPREGLRARISRLTRLMPVFRAPFASDDVVYRGTHESCHTAKYPKESDILEKYASMDDYQQVIELNMTTTSTIAAGEDGIVGTSDDVTKNDRTPMMTSKNVSDALSEKLEADDPTCTLGRGSFGTVNLYEVNSKFYACKTASVRPSRHSPSEEGDPIRREAIKNELKIMQENDIEKAEKYVKRLKKSPKSPFWKHVLPVLDVVKNTIVFPVGLETDTMLRKVMDRAPDLMSKRNVVTNVLQKLIEIVKAFEDAGFAHGDMKLGNVVVTSLTDDGQISSLKAIDYLDGRWNARKSKRFKVMTYKPADGGFAIDPENPNGADYLACFLTMMQWAYKFRANVSKEVDAFLKTFAGCCHMSYAFTKSGPTYAETQQIFNFTKGEPPKNHSRWEWEADEQHRVAYSFAEALDGNDMRSLIEKHGPVFRLWKKGRKHRFIAHGRTSSFINLQNDVFSKEESARVGMIVNGRLVLDEEEEDEDEEEEDEEEESSATLGSQDTDAGESGGGDDTQMSKEGSESSRSITLGSRDTDVMSSDDEALANALERVAKSNPMSDEALAKKPT